MSWSGEGQVNHFKSSGVRPSWTFVGVFEGVWFEGVLFWVWA